MYDPKKEYIISELIRGLSDHINGIEIDFNKFTELANIAKDYEPDLIAQIMISFKMGKSNGRKEI